MSSMMSCNSCMIGGARGKSLSKETKDTLYAKAQKYDIKGRSTMTKSELVAAIRKAQAEIGKRISQRRR